MKYATRYLILFGCWGLGSIALMPATAPASPPKRAETVTDKLHTPPEGSAERDAVLDGLRRHWQASRNPDDGRTYRGRITFHVGYLKVHHGWAWVNAEPRSSVSKERFPENSGFLLHLKTGQWHVMKTPPMDDNGDGTFNPSPGDFERIRKMYPTIATDIIPVEKRR
jgi:hypothetical protein